LNDYSPTSHDLRHGKNPLSSVDDGDKYKKWNLLDLDTYDHQDMENRFNFSRIEKDRVHQMGEWKAKDQKGLKKSLYIREVIRRNEKVLSI
jgi:plasmid rolling circle replication initiator protein Rep